MKHCLSGGGHGTATQPTSLTVGDGAGPSASKRILAVVMRMKRSSERVMSLLNMVAHKCQRLTHILVYFALKRTLCPHLPPKIPIFLFFSFIRTEMDVPFDFMFFWGKS